MMGTAYPMQVSDALLATAAADPLRAMAMVNAWSIGTHASKPGYPGPGNWLHGSNLALMRRVQAGTPDANVFLHDFDTCNRYAGGLEAAARVTCPVTMILGRADQMTPPRATREIAAALEAFAAKAKLIAQTMGAARYEVVELNVGGTPLYKSQRGAEMAMMRSADAAAPPIAVDGGTATLTVTVNGQVQLR